MVSHLCFVNQHSYLVKVRWFSCRTMQYHFVSFCCQADSTLWCCHMQKNIAGKKRCQQFEQKHIGIFWAPKKEQAKTGEIEFGNPKAETRVHQSLVILSHPQRCCSRETTANVRCLHSPVLWPAYWKKFHRHGLWSGLFTIEMCLFGNNTMVSTQIHRVTSQNGAWNANKVYMVVPKLTFITSHVRWFDIFLSRKFGNLNLNWQ